MLKKLFASIAAGTVLLSACVATAHTTIVIVRPARVYVYQAPRVVYTYRPGWYYAPRINWLGAVVSNIVMTSIDEAGIISNLERSGWGVQSSTCVATDNLGRCREFQVIATPPQGGVTYSLDYTD